MLTTIQAAQIARECIRQATGFSGPINPDSVLNTIGVVDGDAREAVNDDIVTDPDKGVKHFGHQLGPSDLTFTTESEFFELRDEIFNKAVPLQQTVSAASAKSKRKPAKKKKDNKSKAKERKEK